MLLTSVILTLFAALLTVGIALKYIFGPAPADYHQEMIAAQGDVPGEVVVKVIWALNKVFGFSLIGLAIGFAGLAIFGVYADILWAKVLLLIIGSIVSIPLASVAFKMEKMTGVKAPWRPAVILFVNGLVAFGFSVL